MGRSPAYFAAMIYLPSRCRSCGKVALVAVHELQYGASPCLGCGGELAPLAGCAYPEGDIALFAELSRLVHESKICGLEARRLAFALERSSDAGEDGLEWLAERIPALQPMRRMLEPYRDRRQQVVTMLSTIFHGRSEGQSVDSATGALVASDALGAFHEAQRPTHVFPYAR